MCHIYSEDCFLRLDDVWIRMSYTSSVYVCVCVFQMGCAQWFLIQTEADLENQRSIGGKIV